jgi:co-chaperonin GroES (HSP10)
MLIPILHRLILKLDSLEEVTKSGIVLPKDLIKKERKAIEIGTVVAIGETAFKDYGGNVNTVSIGDRVIIAQYSGKEIEDVDGTIYVVINDEDVLTIRKDTE